MTFLGGLEVFNAVLAKAYSTPRPLAAFQTQSQVKNGKRLLKGPGNNKKSIMVKLYYTTNS